MKQYIFGIDLGGTTVKLGLFTVEGELLDKWEIPTRTEHAGEEILPDIAAALKAKLEERGISVSQVAGVGLGVPGAVLEDRFVKPCVNLQGWGGDAAGALSALCGCPVKVVNDANAAALGEMWLGGGKGYSNVVFVTLGTGVGGGIIVDGQIVSGLGGAGGEVGHSLLVLDGQPCTCGRSGCWEAYASATALIRQGKEAAASHPDSLLNRYPALTGRDVFDAADDGDAAAKAVLDRYYDYVAAGITNLVNILSPEMVLIGGGISRQGERLLAPIRRYVAANCFGGTERPQPVIQAAQLGNEAGIIGAAAL